MDGETSFGPFTLRWTETGAGPTALLLHGVYAGANRSEWEHLVPLLSGRFTVRSPDLLGCGTSDRPDLGYDADTFVRCVDRLIEDARPDVIVASSLTGAYAVRAAPAVRQLVLITPTGLGRAQTTKGGPIGRALYALGRHTPVGDLATDALVSTPSIRWFLRRQAYADASKVTDRTVEQYHRAGRQRGAKHATLAFVTGQLALHLDPAEVARAQPCVVWARGQAFSEDAEADAWAAAGAEVVRLESGLPQAEEPERVAELVRAPVS